jgi:FlaA1/EpsC-like NDP-sugar epimerase
MFALSSITKAVVRRRVLYLAVVSALELCVFVAAGLAAFLLRFEFIIPPEHMRELALGLPVWVAVEALTYRAFRLAGGGWRFISVHDVVRMFWANLAACVASTGILLAVFGRNFPRSLYILDFLLCFLFSVSARAAVRIILEVSQPRRSSKKDRIFIYGAGAAGVMVARECRSDPSMEYQICGFIDDDPLKIGLVIQGLNVLGPGTALCELAAKFQVHDVLIAIPSARGSQMQKILSYCADAQLHFHTIPPLSEIIRKRNLSTQIRDVTVEDLLNRTPVRLDNHLIRSKLSDQVVLVTGAAGSIGSELVRQIARFHPRLIIGLEMAETALFEIEQEIKETFPQVRFEPVIGNIKDSKRLIEVLETYAPAVIFHAAAYKHVPMMETHLFEAVENNVLGTYNIASLAGEYGVEEFVMISSDKAVRPASIMGLTKRVAEMLVSSLQNGSTKYVSVRFGNVLGSNGSVVPIFRKQIAAGGPVTVTHPQMRRYFMTIPEAAQLVLQACAMGKGGEIFVLDMGEPIRIVDLAKQLILLSGLRADHDIKIEFTGIRPGEKLMEELSANDEETLPTYHEKIHIFTGNGSHIPNVAEWIEQVALMCAERDRGLIVELKDLIPDYSPSAQVLKTLLSDKPARMPTGRETAHPALVRAMTAST